MRVSWCCVAVGLRSWTRECMIAVVGSAGRQLLLNSKGPPSQQRRTSRSTVPAPFCPWHSAAHDTAPTACTPRDRWTHRAYVVRPCGGWCAMYAMGATCRRVRGAPLACSMRPGTVVCSVLLTTRGRSTAPCALQRRQSRSLYSTTASAPMSLSSGTHATQSDRSWLGPIRRQCDKTPHRGAQEAEQLRSRCTRALAWAWLLTPARTRLGNGCSTLSRWDGGSGGGAG